MGGAARPGADPLGYRLALAVAMASFSLLLPNCAGSEVSFCDALADHVEGLAPIEWENGITSSGGDWAAVLSDGITEANDSSRVAVAEAVEDDVGGFRRIREASPSELQAPLDRLRELILQPKEARLRSSDPAVLADIQRVIAASPPEQCGWVR